MDNSVVIVGVEGRRGINANGKNIFLIFWVISILLSTVVAPICIPTNSAKGFPFLHILASSCCSLIYWWWLFWQVWGGISSWFSFAFLGWLVTLSILSYVYWTCVSSFEKCLFRSSAHFLNWVGCFFGAEFCMFFINFGY